MRISDWSSDVCSSVLVPAAWMSMAVFALMALYATIALVWLIKLCEILAMACAPLGPAFTLITLLTGSNWGRPMWGQWRMEERLVGKEWGRTCKCQWSPYYQRKKKRSSTKQVKA